MSDTRISVKDFAHQNGLLRQTVFKAIKRLDITPEIERGDAQHRGQSIAFITQEEASRVLEVLSTGRRMQSRANGTEGEPTEAALYDVGVFYLLRLEPQHDPHRFKVGFASNLAERLRQHRCSAPFTEVIKTWPCRRLWEKTAIECVTVNCERLHTEIFRAQAVADVEDRCNQFFNLMPSPTTTSPPADQPEDFNP